MARRGAVALPGRFNVSNALAALGTVEALGLDVHQPRAALARHCRRAGPHGADRRRPAVHGHRRLRPHGRRARQGARRSFAPVTTGRLIVVFGSAGERDATKRAPMGRVAAEAADLVIVTDEDPRLEDPRTINEAIAGGARAAGARDGETLWVIDDRREAIAHAVEPRPRRRRVLLAGKGHEASIFYGTEKRPWDDRRRGPRGPRRVGVGERRVTDELRAFRVTDGEAWNRFVEAAPYHAFPQLWEWGELRPRRGLETGTPRGRTGARGAARRRPAAPPADAGPRLAPRLRPARADRQARRATGPRRSGGGPAVARPRRAHRDGQGRSGGRHRRTVRGGADAAAVAPGRQGPAADHPRHRPHGRRGRAAGSAAAQASAVREQGRARRRHHRVVRRIRGARCHRPGPGGLQPDLSAHREPCRVRGA